MSERPFMQLYVSDFVGDTLRLSTEAIGAYLLLLIALWNADGVIEDEEETLATVARLPLDRWRTTWAKLRPFFEVSDGRVTHNRLTKEIERFASKAAARSEAGRRGGFAKALKDKGRGVAIAMPEPQHLLETRNKEARMRANPTENLAVVAFDTPDFRALEKLRGKQLGYLCGKSGTITVYASELDDARKLVGLAA
jgi:uncharacterized protein YdaU (DUF1376 family)